MSIYLPQRHRDHRQYNFFSWAGDGAQEKPSAQSINAGRVEHFYPIVVSRLDKKENALCTLCLCGEKVQKKNIRVLESGVNFVNVI